MIRQALAEAIRELVEDDTLRDRLGRAARQRVENAFNVTDAAARLVEHYREVLAVKRRSERCVLGSGRTAFPGNAIPGRLCKYMRQCLCLCLRRDLEVPGFLDFLLWFH